MEEEGADKMSIRESLVFAQVVHEVGASNWETISNLLLKHPLVTRARGFYTPDACQAIYTEMMKELDPQYADALPAGIEKPKAKPNLRLAQKFYKERVAQLVGLIGKHESDFTKLTKEMDDIQTGKLDDQIAIEFASPPPKSNGTASPRTQPFALPPDTVPESDEDVAEEKQPSPMDEDVDMGVGIDESFDDPVAPVSAAEAPEIEEEPKETNEDAEMVEDEVAVMVQRTPPPADATTSTGETNSTAPVEDIPQEGDFRESGPEREPSLPPPPPLSAEEPVLEPPPQPTSSFAEVRIVDEVREEEPEVDQPEVEDVPETVPEEVHDEDVVQETPEAESSVGAATVETAVENVPEASPIAASPHPSSPSPEVMKQEHVSPSREATEDPTEGGSDTEETKTPEPTRGTRSQASNKKAAPSNKRKQSEAQSDRKRRRTSPGTDREEESAPAGRGTRRSRLSAAPNVSQAGSSTTSSRGARPFNKALEVLHGTINTLKGYSMFAEPVTDRLADGYSKVVFEPQDLKTIKTNIRNGTISTTDEYERAIYLMFSNALMYNLPGSAAANDASDMMRLVEQNIFNHRQMEYARGSK